MLDDGTFPTNSTYRAPFTVTDRDGNALDLSDSSIVYAIAEHRGGEPLYRVTDADAALTVEPSGERGTIEVTVPADEIVWTGTVIEELRVTRGDTSLVVSQRPVTFIDVVTDP